MTAAYYYKRRNVLAYRNPFKKGGRGVKYGKWEVRSSHEDFTAAATAMRTDNRGLYDRAVFHRGRRLTDSTGRMLETQPT